MHNKKINNHFLQKALVKNFANKGIVNWLKYKTNESGSFHIKKTRNENQPISKKIFYSSEIENKMNNLESEGIRITRKISKESQFKVEVILSRREVITLKFYSLLSGVRTNKLRNNIRDKKGDYIFNSIVEKSNLTPKKMQEEMICTIIRLWETNKNNITSEIEREIREYSEKIKDMNYTNLVKISNAINSRLLIIKFDSMNLFLSEALNFTEQNEESGGILYSFTPIFPNVGIIFYFDPIAIRGSSATKQNSRIFNNKISDIRNRTEYVNHNLMFNDTKKFILNNKNLSQFELHLSVMNIQSSYYDKKDKFFYKVLFEDEEIANVCNAMALVHCENSIIIYQSFNDIKKAEQEIINRKIIRIEDSI